jgi:hypothetical protein
MRGGPSHDATCHGASRLVSRSDIERFKGMAFDKASIQAVSSVLWNPSVPGSEQSYPQKACMNFSVPKNEWHFYLRRLFFSIFPNENPAQAFQFYLLFITEFNKRTSCISSA